MRINPDLFNEDKNLTNCAGCSILSKSKQEHCILDYTQDTFIPGKILFVSESYRLEQGEFTPFAWNEEDLIIDCFSSLGKEELIPDIRYTAASKCPQVKDGDMSASDRATCKNYLHVSIEKYSPEIIFLCGNLPLKMLLNKSGITLKRGKLFDYNGIPVVPLLHPMQVIIEPKNRYLFQLDIGNALDQHFDRISSNTKFQFNILESIESIVNTLTTIRSEYGVWGYMSLDIETTGLNFRKDKVQTIAVSFDYPNGIRTFSIPLYHKDHFVTEDYKNKVIETLSMFYDTPVILHKANFDFKFLYNLGLKKFEHIFDTKLIQHMCNENLPKSLKDLVQYYFPSEQDQI